MSRAGAPRWRYIALRLHAASPLPRHAVQDTLHRAARAAGLGGEAAPALTRYGWPHGIVRVRHTHAEAARRLLAAMESIADGPRRVPVRVEPLSTSGTIAALTRRLGILQERGAPAARRSGAPRRPRDDRRPQQSKPRRQ